MGSTPTADRRACVRFETVGELWGTFEVHQTARILDLSRGGTLIESPVPAPLDTVKKVGVMLAGHEIVVDAKVRHVRRQTPGPEGPEAFLIGLEFLGSPGAIASVLAHSVP